MNDGRQTGHAWLGGAKSGVVGSFANGFEKDIDAVCNAIESLNQ